MNYNDAYEKLKKHDQLHLLKYYDELSDDSKKSLLSQIENIDFSIIQLFDTDNENNERGSFEPLGALTISDINKNYDKYTNTGIDAIKNRKVGAVLLAGGQGTRLGFEHPKGMFNIGVSKKLYIFECLVNNLMSVVKRADTWIPLYIMTSEKNYNETKNFFKENNFFGYNEEYVMFFIQDMAPSVDMNGKIYLEAKDCISLSPNGNGGWFSSMARAGLLEKIKDNGIEWLNVFAVDNVLQRIADPTFIGAVIESGCESGGKVVSKADPDEKVGVLCLEDGRPSIVEYYEMTEEMRTRRENDGTLSYNYGVILNYLFKTEKLEKIMNDHMPIHVVSKKIPYINESAELISPEEPNGFKFETLVLDMVHMQDSCLSYEVERNHEFAPVKNAKGVDSVESARTLLMENGIEI